MLPRRLYLREIGCLPAWHRFPYACGKYYRLSSLFERSSEEAHRSNVVLGFLQNPCDYPVLATLWYTQLSWMATAVRLCLFDMLYVRKSLLVVPLGRWIDTGTLKVEVYQFPRVPLFSVVQLCFEDAEDVEGNTMLTQFCLIKMPESTNYNDFPRYSIKFPEIKVKQADSSLKCQVFGWNPSSEESEPFYDAVLCVLDSQESMLSVYSSFLLDSEEFLSLLLEISQEKTSSSIKALKYIELITSWACYLRSKDFARLNQFPRSCSHVRELQLPVVFAECPDQSQLVPACVECLQNFLNKFAHDDRPMFKMLFIRQAQLSFRGSGLANANFGLSLDGDCLLLSKFFDLQQNPFSSQAFIFNTLTFQLDTVVESLRGLSLVLPSVSDNRPHRLSNEAFLSGKSLRQINDSTCRFFLVNDAVEEDSSSPSSPRYSTSSLSMPDDNSVAASDSATSTISRS